MKKEEVKIAVRLDNIEAFELAERQKLQLENDGYTLVDSSITFDFYTATYVKANFCKYIKEVEIRDPDTLDTVTIEIFKDPESGTIFGIDSTYIEQVNNQIPSPFNPNIILDLP